nr:LCP family protein [Paenibacillus sp. Marseille-Q4541]
MLLLSLGLLVFGTGIFSYNIYRTVANSVQTMYKPLEGDLSKLASVQLLEPVSILLMGVDERPGDEGRSDTMVVLTVNPKTEKTTMVSIPRDTKAYIPMKERYNKINAAYAYGGVEGAVETVEKFLDIPIHYYVKMNMEGFRDIVDAVGGIDIDNPFAFTLEDVYIPEGKQHVDGKTALQYARMRKEDPRGDFGRQQRQREVIEQVIKEGASLRSLGNTTAILNALEKNIETNLTLDQIITMQRSYSKASNQIEQIEIKGEGGMFGGDIWYYVVDEQTKKELSKALQKELELESVSSRKL